MNIFKKLVVFMMTLVFSITVFAEDTSAYTTLGFKIPPGVTIVFKVRQNFGATTMSHMNEAFYQWNKYAGKTLMGRDPTVRHTKTSYSEKDCMSAVYKTPRYVETYVGLATIYRLPGINTLLEEADININVAYRFANGEVQGCYDTRSVFVHEAGHVAGLGHSANSYSIMWHESYPNNIEFRTPKPDDIQGIQHLY